jgi:hypothetical protein
LIGGSVKEMTDNAKIHIDKPIAHSSKDGIKEIPWKETKSLQEKYFKHGFALINK